MVKALCILAASATQFGIAWSVMSQWTDPSPLLEISFTTMCAGFLIACVRFGWDK